jgi:hypothetical protein
MMTRSLRILLDGLRAGFGRRLVQAHWPQPTIEVALENELLQLPVDGAEERWIADVEAHLRGRNRLQPPFAELPKRLGPLG